MIIMSSAKQDIVVQIARNFTNIDVSLPRLERLVKVICNRFGSCEGERMVVGIAIVDNSEMRKANTRFLNRGSTSDCLSFDLSDDDMRSPRIFELVVNGELAVSEANLRGHSGEAELALYVTHSLLHQFGFDDSTKIKAKKMHETEDEILQQCGYGLVYNK